MAPNFEPGVVPDRLEAIHHDSMALAEHRSVDPRTLGDRKRSYSDDRCRVSGRESAAANWPDPDP